VAVSPEEIGLHGCWQVIAVERQSQDLTKPAEPPSLEIGYYATSLRTPDLVGEEKVVMEKGWHCFCDKR